MLNETLEPCTSENEQLLTMETLELRLLYKTDLARALNLICLDSGLFPQRYLDDTTVPYGGE